MHCTMYGRQWGVRFTTSGNFIHVIHSRWRVAALAILFRQSYTWNCRYPDVIQPVVSRFDLEVPLCKADASEEKCARKKVRSTSESPRRARAIRSQSGKSN